MLAHFLGVSAPPEFLEPPVRPPAQGADPRRYFATCSSARARRRSVVLIVENMHWVDAASEEFLAHLARGLPGHRILLVLTTRPGYARALARFSAGGDDHRRRASAAGRRPRDGPDPARARRRSPSSSSRSSPRRARGIRCTWRRFIRQLQETSGIVVENGEARLSRPDVTVPATIHDIIAARVDRLAEAH